MLLTSYNTWRLSSGFINVQFTDALEKSCFVGQNRGTALLERIYWSVRKGIVLQFYFSILYCNFIHKSLLHQTPLIQASFWIQHLPVSPTIFLSSISYHFLSFWFVTSILKLWISDFSVLSYLCVKLLLIQVGLKIQFSFALCLSVCMCVGAGVYSSTEKFWFFLNHCTIFKKRAVFLFSILIYLHSIVLRQ